MFCFMCFLQFPNTNPFPLELLLFLKQDHEGTAQQVENNKFETTCSSSITCLNILFLCFRYLVFE